MKPFRLALALAISASACTGIFDAGKSGTGGGGGTTGGGIEPPVVPLYPFQPVATSSAVAKVKNLLLGTAPTDAEVEAVASGLADGGPAGGSAAMAALIGNWVATPGQTAVDPNNLTPYQAKMLNFFATAFQQTQVSVDEFRALNDMFSGLDLGQVSSQMLANNQQMMALTALELIAENKPFSDVMQTQRFMMTPALRTYYAALDTQITDDSAKLHDETLIANPNFYYKLTGAGPIPIAESLNDAGPNYMTFYAPTLASGGSGVNLDGGDWATCLAAEPWVYTRQSVRMRAVTDALYFSLFGDNQDTAYALDAGSRIIQCQPKDSPNYFNVFLDGGTYINQSDFTTWSMTNIRQPAAGEGTTLFYDLPRLRDPKRDLVLHTPRVGYFTTQTFFAGWSTNVSNQARVTINQTMIVGLGQAFDISNFPYQPTNLEAVDPEHAPAGSPCFNCHVTLDPMRQFFRQAYSIDFSIQTDAGQTAMPGQFAFHEAPVTGTGIVDLGTLIAGHPMLAKAWVQRLCTYATSAVCDDTDPVFLQIVSDFQASHFNWNAMVTELFASPLVTYLGETASSDSQGETFGIARKSHLCSLLSNRLGYTDVCGLLPTTQLPGQMRTVQTIASALPSDQYSRGSVTPVLANDPTLFFRTGLENICSGVASQVIDNSTYPAGYSSTNPNPAIAAFVSTLMGLTSDRAAGPLAILQSHFAEARAQGASASTALKSTFILACLSPYVAGMGQ